MRSVVVVLPASMWAMIPMLRVFSSEYCRSTSAALPPYDSSSHAKRGVRLRPPLHFDLQLPAIMRERLVGLRHLVRVFSLLHCGAAVAGGVEQLAGELLGHAALASTPGGADDPPHRQRGATFGTHFDRNLVRQTADPPRLDLDRGLYVVDRGLEHLERVLLAPILDRPQGLVHDLLGRRLLAADHHDVHELRHQPAPVLRIRQHFTLGRSRPSHSLTRRLRDFGAVLRPALLAARHPGGVERPPDDVIADPGEILHAAAPDHDDRVLLQIVADARDVRRDFEPVRQPHPSDLAERGVRLLGRRRVDADADTPFLGTPLHRGRFRLLPHRLTTLMDQLVDGRHDSPSPSRRQNSHFITLRPCGVNDLGRTIYPATATDSSASPSGTGGGVSDSTLSSDFTASPPGVSTSTRV